MNWKFWQKKPQPTIAPVVMDDPTWPQVREALLHRLAVTPDSDPLMAGLLGMLSREIAVQVAQCESAGLTDAQAHGVTSRIGVLVALKRDIEQAWRNARQTAKEQAAQANARQAGNG